MKVYRPALTSSACDTLQAVADNVVISNSVVVLVLNRVTRGMLGNVPKSRDVFAAMAQMFSPILLSASITFDDMT